MVEAQGFLMFAGIILRLLGDGAVTVQKLRDIAKEAGATPEELALMDKRLTDAISDREAGR